MDEIATCPELLVELLVLLADGCNDDDSCCTRRTAGRGGRPSLDKSFTRTVDWSGKSCFSFVLGVVTKGQDESYDFDSSIRESETSPDFSNLIMARLLSSKTRTVLSLVNSFLLYCHTVAGEVSSSAN